MQSGCYAEKKPASVADEARLQKDLAGSYYWSGEWCRDYRFFVANWHPLIGIWCCHPLHPWSKTERVAMMIFSVGVSTMPSAFLAITAHQAKDIENTEIIQRTAGGVVFVFVTLPIMLVEVALYWIAIGDVFFKGRCDCIAATIRCFKSCCFISLVLLTIMVAGMSCIAVVAAKAEMKLMWYPVATARVQSWFMWFFIWTFLPYLGFAHGWCKERDALRNAVDPVSGIEMGAPKKSCA